MNFLKVALLIGVGVGLGLVGYKLFQNHQKMSTDSRENDNASEDNATETTEENQEAQPDTDAAPVNA
jgi:uncharacterized membrane protein YebE (DUF533 family)